MFDVRMKESFRFWALYVSRGVVLFVNVTEGTYDTHTCNTFMELLKLLIALFIVIIICIFFWFIYLLNRQAGH